MIPPRVRGEGPLWMLSHCPEKFFVVLAHPGKSVVHRIRSPRIRFLPMEEGGSPGHRIAGLPASRLDFVDRFQDIPDWVWAPARQGRGKVLFDASAEAKPHEPQRARTLHGFLERAGVAAGQAVYLTQDRGYADAYLAYCKASGVRPMRVLVHDYWLGEVIGQHAQDGGETFE